jgi:hypothetical protein
MDLPDDAESLRRIVDYRTARAAVRGIGAGSIVCGLIYIALVALGPGVISQAVIALGVVMIGVGVGSLLRPAPAWLLIDGLTVGGIGLLNISLPFLTYVLTGQVPIFSWGVFGLLGLFFLLGGIKRLRDYARFGHVLTDPPAAAEMLALEALVRRAARADPTKDEEVIAFRVKTFGGLREWRRLSPGDLIGQSITAVMLGGPREWRGLFHGRAILFVELPLETALAADRDDVEFRVEGKANSEGQLRATLRVGEKTWAATISAGALGRFDAWKGGEYDEPEEDGPDDSRADEEPPATGIKPP